MLLSASVCVCVPCPCSSQLKKKNKKKTLVWILTSPAYSSYCPTKRDFFPFAARTQIVCKSPPRWLFFHVKVSTANHTGKSVGRRRLALRVHRLLYPAESKVAEFLCKFKCLLPHAGLNFDLHVAPLCCWTREHKRGTTILGEDVVSSFGLAADKGSSWSSSQVLLNVWRQKTAFCSVDRSLLKILFVFCFAVIILMFS